MTDPTRRRVTFAQVITPEHAQHMLATMKYDHQRPLSEARKRQYIAEMKAGRFRELTQILIGIYLDRHVILDGQHRLNAIVESGIPVLCDVVEIEVDSAEELARLYSTTDVGKGRTMVDALGAHAVNNELGLADQRGRRFAHAVKFLMTGAMTTGTSIPVETVIEAMRNFAPEMRVYNTLLDDLKPSRAVWASLLRSSSIGLALLSFRFSAPKAEREGRPSVCAFWTGVMTDDGLRLTDPRKVAHHHLTESRFQSTHVVRRGVMTNASYSIRYLGNCLNSYIAGREQRGSKVFDEKAPLNVYGIPSDPSRWW